jgi:putative ABC transport system permease protein
LEHREYAFELSGGAQAEEINAGRLSSAMFPTLGVPPVLGRVFTREEDDSRQPVAVISYALWTNRYHRDAHVLGSPIVLDRKPYSVIGVMPRGFEFPVFVRPSSSSAGLGASEPDSRRTL